MSKAKSKVRVLARNGAGKNGQGRLTREERNEKIKDLVALAKTQGYLTYNDIHETLPPTVINPEEVDGILILLRGMDIEVLETSDVDRFKREAAAEEAAVAQQARLETLDDPVRMYLK